MKAHLNTELSQCLRWSFSLGKKFLRKAPLHTVSVQFIYIFSQLLLLLAFFLPLKAIIVLSSGGIPSYFPEFLKAYAQDTVVIWLSLSSLVAFAAHLTFELVATKITAAGARLLIIRTKKIVLFDNQDFIAVNAYSKFTRGLSELLFFLISVAILCAIYPLIFSLVSTSIIVFYTFTCLAYNTSSKARSALTTHHQAILNSISGFVFLVVFFGIIGDFLYFHPPSAFMAIISLLLIRQALQRLVGFSTKLILLRSQHSRVSALFFHNQPLLLENTQKSDKIHALFSPEQRERWIPQVLSPLFKTAFTVEGVKNFQLGHPDIYCYEVDCHSENTVKTYIIKLFDESRTYPAAQESALIAQFKDLPCPPLRETGKLQNVTYHIFEWSKECKMTGREYNQGTLTLLGDLMKLTPPKSLLNKYERSKSYLESRLNSEMLESLKLYAVTAEDQKNIEQLAGSLGSIKLNLSKLPRQLIVLDLNTDSLLKKETGELSVIHWGNWLLEPAGTYWPLTAHSKLLECTQEAQGIRSDAQSLSSDGTILASYMFSFERHIIRRDYQAALNLIPDILKHTQNLDEKIM
ncbi:MULTISPECIES: hypothetical protein [unclassified Pseudomonas]|uniref:hypothetical protein n=1 Tax=unclassified Pseudomonas TaxID=196821 RepID=UPI0011B48BD1|nr:MULTISPECIES: hypothetical protein [unclassified Pseudomonas]